MGSNSSIPHDSANLADAKPDVELFYSLKAASASFGDVAG
jgi:hypothetical protein